jgi:hypothetical protein
MCGCKFRRQQPFDRYVLDFFCAERRLAVELDGREHGETSAQVHDRERDEYLRGQGVRLLRFWNFQLRENLEGVLERIRMEVENEMRGGTMPPHPNPLPQGEREKDRNSLPQGERGSRAWRAAGLRIAPIRFVERRPPTPKLASAGR